LLARPDGTLAALAPAPDNSESWPRFGEDEIAAVAEVLRSGKVNQWTGDKVLAFERAYERLIGSGHAIALANGSVALELALRAFGIGPGDEVVVTPRSFVASASCVRLVGATPVFADIDRDSGNISAATITDALTPRTRAIIPVHLGGWPCDMPAIMALARDAGIKVIEDCAQAHGAEIDGRPVGSFGDAAAFSFCQDKIITTGGEGGLAVFRDEAAADWAWSYKDHGKNRAKIDRDAPATGFKWLHDRIGTNWRLLETSAAIGLVQLGKLERWRELRTRNAAIWAEALAAIPGVRVPRPADELTPAYYKFFAYLPVFPEVEARRARLFEAASTLGIRVFSGACPEIYREAAFSDLAVTPLPVAHELGRTTLMLEVHPSLDPIRLRRRATTLAAIVHEAVVEPAAALVP
jgi:dTDP-4-amino-4,6-dideoxygalactose transaminase